LSRFLDSYQTSIRRDLSAVLREGTCQFLQGLGALDGFGLMGGAPILNYLSVAQAFTPGKMKGSSFKSPH